MMTAPHNAPGRCLNCEAPLSGPFCAACGQRSVPANPTVHELVGDAWRELTGYDGRLAHTLRSLLLHPGQLTRAFLDGRRAQYISPVRLYLTASLVYFLAAFVALSPDGSARTAAPGGLRIGITNADITDPEDRERLRDQIADAPRLVQPLLHAIIENPDAFRRRVFETMPRVFFAMLPVFAGITTLFYRRRPFPTHLTFTTHLHAFAFIILTAVELAKLPRITWLADIVAAAAAGAVLVYGLLAFRSVYREPWARTVLKSGGIAFLYLLSSIPAFGVILAWASFG